MNSTTEIKYKITIEKIEVKTFPSQTEILTEERHYTDAEISESHQWMKERDYKDYTKKLYGKKDTIGSTKTETKIYEQMVEGPLFNLKDIVKAVNEIPNDSK